jgi:hypothetical protein
MAEDGYKMKDLTVLAPQNDPFRVDTPANHRDGQWFKQVAERALELKGSDSTHLRGCHYAALSMEAVKPNGEPYRNTERDWAWLQNKAGKAGRWLGYVPFDRITDERNSPPVVRRFTPHRPWESISVADVEIKIPADLAPRPMLLDFRGVQPYRLVIVGEKTSLEDVLAPVAEAREADLYLPTGESSDTLIWMMARDAAEDGRPLVVFYFSDCDPEGYGMGRNVARKLQAFRALQFPELRFQLRPVALTPDQVREYGLPSTPIETDAKSEAALKAAATKRQKWVDAFGVEQTEIDAIATLQPQLLRELAMKATLPFYDAGLHRRVAAVLREWEMSAERALADQLDEDELGRIRVEAEAQLSELEDQVAAINDALRVDTGDIDLPDIPDVPDAEVDGVDGTPSPLVDSDWTFAEQCARLIAHKSYTDKAV